MLLQFPKADSVVEFLRHLPSKTIAADADMPGFLENLRRQTTTRSSKEFGMQRVGEWTIQTPAEPFNLKGSYTAI